MTITTGRNSIIYRGNGTENPGGEYEIKKVSGIGGTVIFGAAPAVGLRVRRISWRV